MQAISGWVLPCTGQDDWELWRVWPVCYPTYTRNCLASLCCSVHPLSLCYQTTLWSQLWTSQKPLMSWPLSARLSIAMWVTHKKRAMCGASAASSWKSSQGYHGYIVMLPLMGQVVVIIDARGWMGWEGDRCRSHEIRLGHWQFGHLEGIDADSIVFLQSLHRKEIGDERCRGDDWSASSRESERRRHKQRFRVIITRTEEKEDQNFSLMRIWIFLFYWYFVVSLHSLSYGLFIASNIIKE